MDRRSFLHAASAVALTGCAGAGGAPDAPVAPAPVYRVGDRWVYRAKDGYRAPVVWDETHEVVGVGADGIVVRITQKGPTLENQRTERLAAPGIVTVGAVFDNETRRFAPPLRRFEFPLTPGARWNQSLDSYDEALGKQDPLQRTVIVRGWEQVTTPAGTFDALSMRVFMQLNLNDPFKYPTQCNYELWWSPVAGATVRETKYATYREKGDIVGGVEFRSQNAVLELSSYRRAGG